MGEGELWKLPEKLRGDCLQLVRSAIVHVGVQ